MATRFEYFPGTDPSGTGESIPAGDPLTGGYLRDVIADADPGSIYDGGLPTPISTTHTWNTIGDLQSITNGRGIRTSFLTNSMGKAAAPPTSPTPPIPTERSPPAPATTTPPAAPRRSTTTVTRPPPTSTPAPTPSASRSPMERSSGICAPVAIRMDWLPGSHHIKEALPFRRQRLSASDIYEAVHSLVEECLQELKQDMQTDAREQARRHSRIETMYLREPSNGLWSAVRLNRPATGHVPTTAVRDDPSTWARFEVCGEFTVSLRLEFTVIERFSADKSAFVEVQVYYFAQRKDSFLMSDILERGQFSSGSGWLNKIILLGYDD